MTVYQMYYCYLSKSKTVQRWSTRNRSSGTSVGLLQNCTSKNNQPSPWKPKGRITKVTHIHIHIWTLEPTTLHTILGRLYELNRLCDCYVSYLKHCSLDIMKCRLWLESNVASLSLSMQNKTCDQDSNGPNIVRAIGYLPRWRVKLIELGYWMPANIVWLCHQVVACWLL